MFVSIIIIAIVEGGLTPVHVSTLGGEPDEVPGDEGDATRHDHEKRGDSYVALQRSQSHSLHSLVVLFPSTSSFHVRMINTFENLGQEHALYLKWIISLKQRF